MKWFEIDIFTFVSPIFSYIARKLDGDLDLNWKKGELFDFGLDKEILFVVVSVELKFDVAFDWGFGLWFDWGFGHRFDFGFVYKLEFVIFFVFVQG